MPQLEYKNIRLGYVIFTVLVIMAFACILAKGAYIIFAEGEYWEQVASRLKKDGIIVTPRRGSIYSADGKLLVSNLPEYKIYFDFEAGGLHKDSALVDSMTLICRGLHRIMPDKSEEAFRRDFRIGRNRRNKDGKLSQHYQLYPRRITYEQYNEIKKLPVFKWSQYKGGFIAETFQMRKKVYGELASRTLGGIYADKDSARFGLELAYDSLLRGAKGLSHRQKVMNKFLTLIDEPAIDGYDLETTIDVSMQDICEKALIDEMKLIGGEEGMVILMEVETGDIKSIVNLTHCKGDGKYHEVKNNCLADLMEPGSTFKTASLMIAFEDSVVNFNETIDTGNGIYNMYGREMKDHNWEKGGYGKISVPRIMQVSSNIGIARIIDDHYHNNPQKFIDGLYRIGIGSNLHMPIPGAASPRIKQPKQKGWYKTTLGWMSIGYETQLPIINTLAFYNAIANNGKLVKPRLLKSVKKNGKIVEKMPVEVIQERICSESTLKKIQIILQTVCDMGSGEKAKTSDFLVAGKTGTAQIANPNGKGYIWDDGIHHYMCSFCGYFPANDPKYSCIVAIKKEGPYASGGAMAGPVFGNIASRVYAKEIRRNPIETYKNDSPILPDSKAGDIVALHNILNYLSIDVENGWKDSYANGNPIWGKAVKHDNSVSLEKEKIARGTVPDVKGMGARDAVFLLETLGFKVKINGIGQVFEQSIEPGKSYSKGEFISLRLKSAPHRKANVVKVKEPTAEEQQNAHID
ncbi:MAG: transpeptidase family protein [Bacteroidaceae bacterium]|nr:transpeptidase family protein [Bacteroidaceae bacterium]MBR5764867.1 transpeptidase family protein [Bacteroidaceae bacterium]